MKLKIVEFDGSSHRRVETKSGKVIGLFYLDVSGSYYFEHLGTGYLEAHTLRDIARELDIINKPFQDKLKEDFKLKVGDKVLVKNEGKNYSTYWDMFYKLGFKDPKNPKSIHSFYQTEDVLFTIFALAIHENGTNLCAIKDEAGNEFLFGEKGLKRYKEQINLDF